MNPSNFYGLTAYQLNAAPTGSVTENLHSTTSVIAEMDTAIQDVRDEIATLEQNTQSALRDIQAIVGNLSDLRYGRLTYIPGVIGNAAEEALEGLSRLDKELATASCSTHESRT